MAAIKRLSPNCHGYNAGTESYLRQYCQDTDVFLLQETWLSGCTCSVLDNFHKDFAAFHTSAMEDKISGNIMLGRPTLSPRSLTFPWTALLDFNPSSTLDFCFRTTVRSLRVRQIKLARSALWRTII